MGVHVQELECVIQCQARFHAHEKECGINYQARFHTQEEECDIQSQARVHAQEKEYLVLLIIPGKQETLGKTLLFWNFE